jgi:3,4-dihydroxy 2-butanone 4-phosphate synthase/GTP cyclohydrolase II
MGISSIEEAVAAIAAGSMAVVVDDEDRENEGDLVMAAEAATPERVAFFLEHTSGVICVPVESERADALDLPLMVLANTEAQRTAFTVSVDYRHGTSTGISASDRSLTIRALADPKTKGSDFNRPGHVYPLRAQPGGVLKRAGHTEAAIDLCRMAERAPIGMLCEIVTADKLRMARMPDLVAFAANHGLPLISIADLIRYRRHHEQLVRRMAEAKMPNDAGDGFRAVVYESVLDGELHLALVLGDVAGKENVLVRVHSECLTGDVFGSLRCDCGKQLHAALETIAKEGSGVVVYLRGQEGRGIGLGHKMRAYALQEDGRDTVDANLELGFAPELRQYGTGAQILVDLGISTMRLMTNNPDKYGGLEGFGLDITERVPLESSPTEFNIEYLRTKRDRMGHLLEGLDLEVTAPTDGNDRQDKGLDGAVG